MKTFRSMGPPKYGGIFSLKGFFMTDRVANFIEKIFGNLGKFKETGREAANIFSSNLNT